MWVEYPCNSDLFPVTILPVMYSYHFFERIALRILFSPYLQPTKFVLVLDWYHSFWGNVIKRLHFRHLMNGCNIFSNFFYFFPIFSEIIRILIYGKISLRIVGLGFNIFSTICSNNRGHWFFSKIFEIPKNFQILIFHINFCLWVGYNIYFHPL